VNAAGALFAERGYAATTIEAIADAADVAVETIYKRFGNKRNLLSAYIDVSVVGDHQAVPLLERDEVRAIAAETDQRRQIRRLAKLARTLLERAMPSQQILWGAAVVDRSLEDAIAIDDQRRRITHRAFVKMLLQNGPLRPGLSLDEATDTYSALSNPWTYAFLTQRRGWSPNHFERWIANCFEQLLLPHSVEPAPNRARRNDR
jgi:AcrR family transcriptional regulator